MKHIALPLALALIAFITVTECTTKGEKGVFKHVQL